MSGIAVVYNRVGPGVDLRLLDLLMRELAWRGRDQAGTWNDDRAGLGANQLWTTPEDRDSSQPFASPDGMFVLAYDGRLDNRPELMDALGLRSGRGAAQSDAALVGAAYARWGESFARHLVGPFSVAVWDWRKHRLVCARDPLGQRPLYYRLTRTHFYAASTIAAMRQVPGVTTDLNDDYIWDFLCTAGRCGSLDAGETPFTDIRRLAPGHTIVVNRDRVRVERDWEPWNLQPLRYGDDREYAEHFRELFSTVLRAHNRALGPVCATLSGGLDSSSIVCAIRAMEQSGQIDAEPVQTLSLVWKDAEGGREGYDERKYVEDVVGRYPGPAHFLPAEQLHHFDFFARTTPAYDEPFTLFGRKLWDILSLKTGELGSRVLLAGSGGDHLLTGNHFYLTDLLRKAALRQLLGHLRDEASRQGLPYPALVAGYVVSPHLPRHRGAALVRALTKEIDRRHVHTLYYWQVPGWIQGAPRQERRGRRRHRLLRRRFTSFAAQWDYEQLAVGSQDHLRLPLSNIALVNGVDLRNPFFDTRLAEFCLRLPSRLKFRNGATKMVLRLAMRDVMPDSIVLRPDKTAYNFAIADHVKQHWLTIQDAYRDSESDRLGYVHAKVLLNALGQLQQGGSGALQLPAALAALGLEDWLQQIQYPGTPGAGTSHAERSAAIS